MHPAVDAVLRPLRKGKATVLTLHRFGDDKEVSVSVLRSQLEYLRARGYVLAPLSSQIEALVAGRKPAENAVSFTVDDGYADFRDLAAPVFEEFDCPVTLFVTTGPIDRTTWFWWDRVEYAFENTQVRQLDLEVGPRKVSYAWHSPAEKLRASLGVTAQLKQVANWERLDALDRLGTALGVDTSGPAPRQYEAMTWDDLRRLAGSGRVELAPHTVTHPILSRLDDAQLTAEIGESWRRLREQCPKAVPIFCYPNGKAADYSPRTIASLREAGMLAAMTTEPDYLTKLGSDRDTLYRLPRYACPNDLPHFVQIVNGLEGAKSSLRRSLRM